jgi:hypothetical protein
VLVFDFHWQDLKQMLNNTVGARSHVIEPRQKGDTILRIRFKSKDVMEIAKTLLHKQIFFGYKLTAVVSRRLSQYHCPLCLHRHMYPFAWQHISWALDLTNSFLDYTKILA